MRSGSTASIVPPCPVPTQTVKHRIKTLLCVIAPILFAGLTVTAWYQQGSQITSDGTPGIEAEIRVPGVLTFTELDFLPESELRWTATIEVRYDSELRAAIPAAARRLQFPGLADAEIRLFYMGTTWSSLATDASSSSDTTESPNDWEQDPDYVRVDSWEMGGSALRRADARLYPFDRYDALSLEHSWDDQPVALDLTVGSLRSSTVAARLANAGWTLGRSRWRSPRGQGKRSLAIVVPIYRRPYKPLLQVLVPLIAVLGLLFLVIRTHKPRTDQVATTAAVLLAVTIFVLWQLGSVAVPGGLLYLEALTSVPLLAIFGAVFAYPRKWPLRVLRAAYWPLTTLLALAITLYYLPALSTMNGSALHGLLLAIVGIQFILLLVGTPAESGHKEGEAPTVPVEVHAEHAGGRPRCGAASEFVDARSSAVTCSVCRHLLEEELSAPEPVDSFPE